MRLRNGLLLGVWALSGACAGSGDGDSPRDGDATSSGAGSGAAGPSHGGSANDSSSSGGSRAGSSASVAGTDKGGSTVGEAGSGGTAGESMVGGGFAPPPANASFDYQIGGAYPPPSGVKVVSRDRGDSPAAGLYNICYVNGFQAQQSDDDWWNGEHPDLILRDAQNNPIIDPDWDEMLLDTSTAEKREALAQIVGNWIEGCATDGFDAVEIDNLDSYSRSDGRLSQANNVAFMKLLADVGHRSGVAMGQKNSAELVSEASVMGTDFAVVEECNRYSECGDYKAGYGDLVFVIEYRDQDFSAGCKNYPELSIVRRDIDVSTPGSAGYVYEGC